MELGPELRYRWPVRHPFRRKNASPRLFPFYAIIAMLFWVARPTPYSFALGLPLLVAGAALRIWGAGHLVKTDRLTVTGPYSHLRHPLYAGTLLVALGFGVASGWWGVGLVALAVLPLFFGYYLPYKDRVESERLVDRYGDDYAGYRAEVPALIPRWHAFSPPRGWSHDAEGVWRWERFHENDEFGTLFGIFVGLALLLMRAVATTS